MHVKFTAGLFASGGKECPSKRKPSVQPLDLEAYAVALALAHTVSEVVSVSPPFPCLPTVALAQVGFKTVNIMTLSI